MAKAGPLGTRVLEHCVSGGWMRSPMPRRGSAGAAVLSRGFAVVGRVSAELPRTTSPSRDLWGSKAGLAPSTDVSRWEACWGRRLRLRHRPGSACQRCVGAALSRRRGAVCSAWRGGAGSSRRRFSEEERTAVTAAHSAVAPCSDLTGRRCHHIPTRDARTPNLLDFHVAKNPFLKAS